MRRMEHRFSLLTWLLISCQLILREGVERHLGFVYTWSLWLNGFKSTDMRCLLFIISQLQDRKIGTGEIGISSGNISYISFGFSRGSLRIGLLAISVAMCVALALSYLTITCHIAYKMLSHIFFFFTYWEESNLHMWFQQADAFTLVQFLQECIPEIKWFKRSDLNPSRKRLGFGWLFFFTIHRCHTIVILSRVMCPSIILFFHITTLSQMKLIVHP